MEAAVIAGEGASEVLVSLGLLKKWDMIHDTFPEETVSDFMQRMTNKHKLAYSSLYNINTDNFNASRKLRPPGKDCTELKARIVNKYRDCFKETLGPKDRMNVPPVKLRIKDPNKTPSFCLRPFDTPYHLRDAYEKELDSCMKAGQLVACGAEPSKWSSKAFPVPKADGKV